MPIRTILSGLILAIGLFLFWGGLDSILFGIKQGSSFGVELMNPPTSLIRMVAASALILGALARLMNWRVGGWLIGLGIVLFCLLAALMALSGADFEMWKDEALISGLLLMLAGALIATRNNSA